MTDPTSGKPLELCFDDEVRIRNIAETKKQGCPGRRGRIIATWNGGAVVSCGPRTIAVPLHALERV